ncbi:MAG: hypothetical protein GX424_01925 [Clostridiales bacterium]|nr:hypothetical protein [Clostridiales bacterium]
MDIFVEQLVKKNREAKDYLIIAGIVLAGLLLIMASTLVPFIAVFVFAGVCVGEYYLITALNLEYEYSVTNGEITIDKIINKRSRKRIISMDAHTIEFMGRYDPQEHSGKNYAARIIVAESGDWKDAWCFSGNHPKKGNVLVVFNPNEKVLAAIKPFLPRQVAVHAFSRH